MLRCPLLISLIYILFYFIFTFFFFSFFFCLLQPNIFYESSPRKSRSIRWSWKVSPYVSRCWKRLFAGITWISAYSVCTATIRWKTRWKLLSNCYFVYRVTAYWWVCSLPRAHPPLRPHALPIVPGNFYIAADENCGFADGFSMYAQDYPKLSQTYYVLLECLAQDHMNFLATLEPQVFLYILSTISDGLNAIGGNNNGFYKWESVE